MATVPSGCHRPLPGARRAHRPPAAPGSLAIVEVGWFARVHRQPSMSEHQHRVVLIQSAVRQYRIPFLEGLRHSLSEHGVGLELLHDRSSPLDDERHDLAPLQWGRATPAREIGVGKRRLLWQTAPRDLWTADLVIVEQASRMLLNYRLLAQRRRSGPKVAFWGHGRNRDPDANALGEAAKRWVSKEPDWWFAYTDGVADLVEELGFPRQRITPLRNSTDTRRLRGLADQIRATEVERFRQDRGIRGAPVGLFVGALVPEKRLDFLIEAADAIAASVPGFALIVAGDGPLKPWLDEQARTRPWLHPVGQCFERDLAVVMKLASFLLIPAWVGLVITDGFAAGRPIITSRAAPHPPEVEYLRHGENGLLIDDGGDPEAYARAVVETIQQPGLLGQLQRACTEDSRRYSVEDMVERCASGVLSALAAGYR